MGRLVTRGPKNLLRYSQQFDNAAWPNFDVVVTPDDIIAPDGTLTADRLRSNDAVGNNSIYQTIAQAGTRNQYVCASVFMREGDLTGCTIGIDDVTAGVWRIRIDYLWVAGVLTLAAEDFGNGLVRDVGGGWYQIYGWANTIIPNNVNNYDLYPHRHGVSEAGYCYAWQAQCNFGNVPDPIVLTTEVALS